MIKEILFREEDLMSETEAKEWEQETENQKAAAELKRLLDEFGIDGDPLELLGKRRVVKEWTRPEASGPDDGDNLG